MKPRYFQFFGSLHPILYFATTPPGAGGAGGDSGAGSGGGSGAGGGTGGGAAAPPPASGQAAPPAINWETAPQQFREGYNKLKSDFDKLTGEYKPWQDWAKEAGVQVDQLGQIHGTYQQVYETISGIAEQLGIAEDEIQEAVEKHGIVKVLNHLQGKAAEAEGGAGGDQGDTSLEERIETAIQQRLSPIEQRENQRLTDQANDRFEQTVNKSIVDAYKAEGVDAANIPKEESFMLMNATSEILKYDEKALIELKKGGGQAAVQKAFQQAKTFLDQYYLSRSGRERGRIQGPPKVKAADGQQRRPTLDEMIEEPTNINAKYKVGV